MTDTIIQVENLKSVWHYLQAIAFIAMTCTHFDQDQFIS